MDMRISTPYILDIGLKMLDIHCVKAYYRCKESDICFCDVLAEIVWSFGGREVFLYPVERGEELRYGFGVGFFGGGEAGAVDAVVDVGVDPFV